MITAKEAKILTKKSEAHFQEFMTDTEKRIRKAAENGDFFICRDIPDEILERVLSSLSVAGYSIPDNQKTIFKISW